MAERHTIDQWRRLKKMSQTELGRLCGVSKTTICTWESNPKRVMFCNAEKIAKALEVDVWDIIFLPTDTN